MLRYWYTRGKHCVGSLEKVQKTSDGGCRIWESFMFHNNHHDVHTHRHTQSTDTSVANDDVNADMERVFGSPVSTPDSFSSGVGDMPESPSSATAAAARGGSGQLTHTDPTTGRATMVDVSHKSSTQRSATATATVILGKEAFRLVHDNHVSKKGDVLTVSQLAGIMGAKHTSELIPLCHPILLSDVSVSLTLDADASSVGVWARATTVGPTGVEMEALTAASVAALTVYDMCKAASKMIEITDIRLIEKKGGKSGHWKRQHLSGANIPLELEIRE